MKNVLIADAGGTKVDWAFVADPDAEPRTLSTPGINALMATDEYIASELALVAASLGDLPVDHIRFYGAGCASDAIKAHMASLLQARWPGADVHVDSDLVGAAISLLGSTRGIACILGTGSNSCLFDGEAVEMQIPSLGFVLGDEGSGASLGKRLVADAFKGHLPQEITKRFLDEYGLTLHDLLDKVYRQPAPNRYLASFVPFISRHLYNPYVYALVAKEMTRFLRRNVVMYPGAHTLPIAVTGSIAAAFRPILEKAAADQGLRIASVTPSPMDGLVRRIKELP